MTSYLIVFIVSPRDPKQILPRKECGLRKFETTFLLERGPTISKMKKGSIAYAHNIKVDEESLV